MTTLAAQALPALISPMRSADVHAALSPSLPSAQAAVEHAAATVIGSQASTALSPTEHLQVLSAVPAALLVAQNPQATHEQKAQALKVLSVAANLPSSSPMTTLAAQALPALISPMRS